MLYFNKPGIFLDSICSLPVPKNPSRPALQVLENTVLPVCPLYTLKQGTDISPSRCRSTWTEPSGNAMICLLDLEVDAVEMPVHVRLPREVLVALLAVVSLAVSLARPDLELPHRDEHDQRNFTQGKGCHLRTCGRAACTNATATASSSAAASSCACASCIATISAGSSCATGTERNSSSSSCVYVRVTVMSDRGVSCEAGPNEIQRVVNRQEPDVKRKARVNVSAAPCTT